MKKAIYYHAGCPVCVAAEQQLLDTLDTQRVALQKIDLGQSPEARVQARQAGVESVPALCIDGAVFHINFGASLADLMGEGA